MKTWSGLDAPVIADYDEPVCPLDIVVHLGREGRFGGWGDKEWTVLHHSMLCSLIWLQRGFPKEELAYILLHDAHEAYMGDIPTPVKRTIYEFSNIKSDPIALLENAIDNQIRATFGLSTPSAETLRRVKWVDCAALLLESLCFGPPGCAERVWAEVPGEFRSELEKALPELLEVARTVGCRRR